MPLDFAQSGPLHLRNEQIWDLRWLLLVRTASHHFYVFDTFVTKQWAIDEAKQQMKGELSKHDEANNWAIIKSKPGLPIPRKNEWVFIRKMALALNGREVDIQNDDVEYWGPSVSVL